MYSGNILEFVDVVEIDKHVISMVIEDGLILNPSLFVFLEMWDESFSLLFPVYHVH